MPCSSIARVALVLLAGSLLVPTRTLAAVTEPNGVVCPRDSQSGDVQLYSYFESVGEPIDWIADAKSEAFTPVPRCPFETTLVLKQSTSTHALAWYNVVPNAMTPPGPADLHVLFPPGHPVGTAASSTAIALDPNYTGQAVGFALISNAGTYVTEPKLAPRCTDCTPAAPWITNVVYPSKTRAEVTYLAFEDGTFPQNAFATSSDFDFNDALYVIEPVRCASAGQVCDTGLSGACTVGSTICPDFDAPTCQQLDAPSAEVCDGVDNDCDGSTDENAQCDAGSTCLQGTCVTAKCAGVACDANEVCVEGACTQPCAGVVCPGATTCRDGRCVDPCAGVACAEGAVCDQGTCRAVCTECGPPCGDGLACNLGTGLCQPSACLGVECTNGTTCMAGACVDSCLGAVCPTGQQCTEGACVAVPLEPSDGGVTDGGSTSGGVTDGGSTSGGITDGGTTDAGHTPEPDAETTPPTGASSSGGTDAPADPTTTPTEDGGCRTTPATPRDGLFWTAVGLAVLVSRRRRTA